MRVRFHFKKTSDYGRRGPRFFESEEIEIVGYGNPVHNKNVVWGSFKYEPSGSSCAWFHYQVRWPTAPEQWFGYTLLRHIKGNKKAATDWLNYLLNNPPQYMQHVNGADRPQSITPNPNLEVRKE